MSVLQRLVGPLVVIAAALVIAGCSSGSAADNTAVFTEADSTLIVIEARWMCDVQRYVFDDLSGFDAELESRLVEQGLSRSDYQSFKERLAEDSDMRGGVRAAYDEVCA